MRVWTCFQKPPKASAPNCLASICQREYSLKSTTFSVLSTSRATESTDPRPSASPSWMLRSPVQKSPLKVSGVSFSRCPRPCLTTSMN